MSEISYISLYPFEFEFEFGVTVKEGHNGDEEDLHQIDLPFSEAGAADFSYGFGYNVCDFILYGMFDFLFC